MALYIGNTKVKMNINGMRVKIHKIINLVKNSLNLPNGTDIYNGVGYQDKMRWSSSGGAETTYAYGRVSGWIPAKKQKTYIVRGFGVNRTKDGYVNGLYIVKHKIDGTIVVSATGRTTGNTYTIDMENDVISFQFTDTNIDYFRVSGYYLKDDGSIINPPLIMIKN